MSAFIWSLPFRQYEAVSILYPIAANAEAALRQPKGRAAREREAERLAGEPVAFVRELTGPSFRSEDEARPLRKVPNSSLRAATALSIRER